MLVIISVSFIEQCNSLSDAYLINQLQGFFLGSKITVAKRAARIFFAQQSQVPFEKDT